MEMQISQRLDILRVQISDVNSRLKTNLRILDEKRSQNQYLKEILSKVQAGMRINENNQSTDVTLSSEALNISCKNCTII